MDRYSAKGDRDFLTITLSLLNNFHFYAMSGRRRPLCNVGRRTMQLETAIKCFSGHWVCRFCASQLLVMGGQRSAYLLLCKTH